MAGLVITIAQRKGGAGKTTLATQLAVAWARCGARVAALDIDPQGSFAAWVELRRARLGVKAIGFDFAALPGWRAAQWVDDRVVRYCRFGGWPLCGCSAISLNRYRDQTGRWRSDL